MRNMLIVSGSVLLVICAGAAIGQQSYSSAGSQRIGVVNITHLWESLQIIQDLEGKFGEQQAKLQQAAKEKNEQITSLQKELESGAFAKDSPDFKSRFEKLIQLRVEAESWKTIQDRRLQDSFREWTGNVYKRVEDACRETAQTQDIELLLAENPINYDVADGNALRGEILRKKVLYASPRIDLTALILERVDSNYLKEGGPDLIKISW